MLLKTKSKMLAARSMLNVLLKDNTKYCNWCGSTYSKETFPCCDNPQVGKHIDHIRGIIRQNKAVRETRKNDFASTDTKQWRWGISLPPKVYQIWDLCFKKSFGCKLFETKEDMASFCKEFKMFAIPKRI